MDSIVCLNVGGVYFVTRRDTLRASSTFFSGIVAAHPECTELFVDRDPTHFRYVLNWLRGVRHLPDDEPTLKELLWEADYYAMHDMREAIVHTKSSYSLRRSVHDLAAEMRQR